MIEIDNQNWCDFNKIYKINNYICYIFSYIILINFWNLNKCKQEFLLQNQ